MDDSFDDFRESYKNLRQSNDRRHKLNGATYRKINNKSDEGNTIIKRESNEVRLKTAEIEQINEKYGLTDNERVYSLNKKKRWEVAPKVAQLIRNEIDENRFVYGKEETERQQKTSGLDDIRVIETRSRNNKMANCIGIHKTKGDQVSVKKTFANLRSIMRNEEIRNQEKLNQNQATAASALENLNRKNRGGRGLSSTKPKIRNEVESIVVDDRVTRNEDDEDEENSYSIEYLVEYAPKKDILKYTPKRIYHDNVLSTSNKFVGSALDYDDVNDEREYEEPAQLESEEECGDLDDQVKEEENLKISMSDLIDNHVNRLLEQETKKAIQKSKQQRLEDVETDPAGTKDHKIFVDDLAELPKFKQQERNEKLLKSSTLDVPATTRFVNSKQSYVRLNKASIDNAKLTEQFGANFSEAFNCWPRSFNVNLGKQVCDQLSTERNIIVSNSSVCVWIRFIEAFSDSSSKISKSYDDSATYGLYEVSFCSNIERRGQKLDTFEDNGEIYEFEQIYDSILNTLINLPADYFRNFEFQVAATNDSGRRDNLATDLPDIVGNTIVRALDDLKLDYLNKSSISPLPVKYERMNSKEVVTYEDSKEKEMAQKKLNEIFDTKQFTCSICFTERFSLEKSVVFKNCAHAVCTSCLRDYVDFILLDPLKNSGKFNCPSCDNEIGLPLLINYASSGNMIDLFIRYSIEKVMFVLNDYKWCPNPICSKIVALDLSSNPYGTVRCTCGYQMCLKCNNQPHFPAKCDKLANYYQELKRLNEFNLIDKSEAYVSRGKRCPNCNVFMEKDRGCNHMHCIMCDKNFCWDCEQPWEMHMKRTKGQSECNITDKKSYTATVSFLDDHVLGDSSKADYVSKSLSHRRMRTNKEKNKKLMDIKRLLTTLKVSDHQVDNEHQQNDQQLSKIQTLIERNKLHARWLSSNEKFLKDLVTFLNELHFICEHSYLSLNDKSIKTETKLKMSAILKNLEILIWSMDQKFQTGSGFGCIEKLRDLYQKGLNCIRLLKGLKFDD